MMKYWVIYLLFVATPMLAVQAVADEGNIMQGMTAAHNGVRAKVGLLGLAWSDELARVAQQWADYIAGNNGCRMQHRPQQGQYALEYGENLFWASATIRPDTKREIQQMSSDKVVESWASEVADYDYATNSCRPGRTCGHYTQIVWKHSKEVGCGRAVCIDKSQVWVCNYDPPGNFRGQKPY